MNESIDETINKLVKYKIKKNEIEGLAPFIGTEDFNEHYEFIEDINFVIEEEGRNELKQELKVIIQNEKIIEKRGKIIQLREYRLQAVAALILIICTVGVIKSTTGYNKESNFRKTYLALNERK